MKQLPVLIGLAVGLALVVAASSDANAQPRYESPYGPTLTPYLDYYRLPTGVFDNYNDRLRPRQMLEQRMVRQEAGIGRVARDVGSLELQMRGGTGASFIRPAPVAPTANVPTFMNYSHYFSGGRR